MVDLRKEGGKKILPFFLQVAGYNFDGQVGTLFHTPDFSQGQEGRTAGHLPKKTQVPQKRATNQLLLNPGYEFVLYLKFTFAEKCPVSANTSTEVASGFIFLNKLLFLWYKFFGFVLFLIAHILKYTKSFLYKFNYCIPHTITTLRVYILAIIKVYTHFVMLKAVRPH